MAISTWDEIRTAYHVARIGTVSGAAEALGVHHATVIRHVDALESQLGVKLFQRHPRGYTATEAGQDLLQVAQATDDQFSQLAGRLKGQGEGVTGELVVTSLSALSPLLTPVLVAFQARHPDLTVTSSTGDRVFRLEYGEAHVAIRGGRAPDEPDNVVQPLGKLEVALYASPDYIERNGTDIEGTALAQHRFVGSDDPRSRAPFHVWLSEFVPEERVRFRTGDPEVASEAVRAGAGLGFVSTAEAKGDASLVQVMAPRAEWCPPMWIVTHVDLHRTAKVQAFLTDLKAAAKAWPRI